MDRKKSKKEINKTSRSKKTELKLYVAKRVNELSWFMERNYILREKNCMIDN